jgi:hypothetical protein
LCMGLTRWTWSHRRMKGIWPMMRMWKDIRARNEEIEKRLIYKIINCFYQKFCYYQVNYPKMLNFLIIFKFYCVNVNKLKISFSRFNKILNITSFLFFHFFF